MRNLVSALWTEWKSLDEQIKAADLEVEQIATDDPACRRLRSIPGIGPLIATAIVAAIGSGAAFRRGREFAAFVGLVPRQHSTGGKARLLGISKRGNSYLRKLLIHGARAAVVRMKRERVPFGDWLNGLEQRAPRNVVVTATANKLARIAWAVLSSEEDVFVLDNAFALIDAYICADCSRLSAILLQSCGGPYIVFNEQHFTKLPLSLRDAQLARTGCLLIEHLNNYLTRSEKNGLIPIEGRRRLVQRRSGVALNCTRQMPVWPSAVAQRYGSPLLPSTSIREE